MTKKKKKKEVVHTWCGRTPIRCRSSGCQRAEEKKNTKLPENNNEDDHDADKITIEKNLNEISSYILI